MADVGNLIAEALKLRHTVIERRIRDRSFL